MPSHRKPFSPSSLSPFLLSPPSPRSYLAPEYALSGKLTSASDVFSFGVVLLELIAGRRPVDTSQPPGKESLVEWVSGESLGGLANALSNTFRH